MAVDEIYPKPFGQAKVAEQIYRNLMKLGIQKLHMNHNESSWIHITQSLEHV